MIGMYSLCYREADLEILNLRRFYPLVKRIVIVVGPAIGISDKEDVYPVASRKPSGLQPLG